MNSMRHPQLEEMGELTVRTLPRPKVYSLKLVKRISVGEETKHSKCAGWKCPEFMATNHSSLGSRPTDLWCLRKKSNVSWTSILPSALSFKEHMVNIWPGISKLHMDLFTFCKNLLLKYPSSDFQRTTQFIPLNKLKLSCRMGRRVTQNCPSETTHW